MEYCRAFCLFLIILWVTYYSFFKKKKEPNKTNLPNQVDSPSTTSMPDQTDQKAEANSNDDEGMTEKDALTIISVVGKLGIITILCVAAALFLSYKIKSISIF